MIRLVIYLFRKLAPDSYLQKLFDDRWPMPVRARVRIVCTFSLSEKARVQIGSTFQCQ